MAYPTWALTLLCIVLTASTAHADAKQEAEKQFRAGVSLQKVEDFGAAIAAFESSLRLYRTKAALFNLANCQRASHRYPEALATFEQLKAEFNRELVEPMLGQVNLQIAELKNLTGTLELEVSPAGASIVVDGKLMGEAPLEAPLRLALGDHELRVELEGYEAHAARVHIGPDATLAESVSLKPAAPAALPPPPPTDQPLAPARPPPAAPSPTPEPVAASDEQGNPALSTAGVVTAATGAALLLGGAVTGSWALAIDQSLQEDCVDGHCPRSRRSDVDRMNSLATTTDVLLVVGALATCGGALMLWLNPRGIDAESTHGVGVKVGIDGFQAKLTSRF